MNNNRTSCCGYSCRKHGEAIHLLNYKILQSTEKRYKNNQQITCGCITNKGIQIIHIKLIIINRANLRLGKWVSFEDFTTRWHHSGPEERCSMIKTCCLMKKGCIACLTKK